MELKGRVFAICEMQTGVSKSGTEWKKQMAVIETDGQYPKKVAFDMFGDKIVDLKVGQQVTVNFDIDSREWQGKWFSNINAWKVVVDGAETQSAAPVSEPVSAPAMQASDDLPF